MPLGVRDDVITADTARVTSAQLHVLDVEVPACEVVEEHVELRQEGGPGLVDCRDLVEAASVDDSLLIMGGHSALSIVG